MSLLDKILKAGSYFDYGTTATSNIRGLVGTHASITITDAELKRLRKTGIRVSNVQASDNGMWLADVPRELDADTLAKLIGRA